MDKLENRKEVDSAVKKRKLEYHFHNRNTAEETADYILKVFMEVNKRKVEEAVRVAANKITDDTEIDSEHSA